MTCCHLICCIICNVEGRLYRVDSASFLKWQSEELGFYSLDNVSVLTRAAYGRASGRREMRRHLTTLRGGVAHLCYEYKETPGWRSYSYCPAIACLCCPLRPPFKYRADWHTRTPLRSSFVSYWPRGGSHMPLSAMKYDDKCRLRCSDR